VTRPVRIALTPGEPAGIGPEITARLLQSASDDERVVVGDVALLHERARALGLTLRPYGFTADDPPQPQEPGEVAVAGTTLAQPATPGVLDPANARYVIDSLYSAVDGCLDGTFAALVTGPVHKAVINRGGIAFSGHTELLGERTRGAPVMMLAAEGLRVALVTSHIALRGVPDALTAARVRACTTTLAAELHRRFAIDQPRIAVLGLNPHAGEEGLMGTEERDVIAPVIEQLRSEGLRVRGPVAADTAFTPGQLDSVDAVLAMYHDQGLPVVKHAGFGHAVNITLGLPFVRTSVDHGTALERAGTGTADAASLAAAYAQAAALAPRG
jgi:4-hydroxythreonine-4-phosphate dehydrogenase